MMSQMDYSQKGRDSNEFLAKYQGISNKLKKRFLRKPNVTEACDQFSALANQCEQEGLWQYSGLCWLAAARCQGTLQNTAAEINLLMKAGRQFLEAEKHNEKIGCPSLGQENLQAAWNCFGHCLVRSTSQPGFTMMSAGLVTELALALGANPSGVQQLKKAIEIFPTPQAISILVSYYITQGDYVAALQALTEFVDLIESTMGHVTPGNYSAILHKCEVNRVLLLLILQPSPQRLAPSLAQVLEKYAWIEETVNTGPEMSEDQVLLLQSLVLACQSRDSETLLELEGELWPYLDSEQKDLLRKLVQVMTER